MMRYLIFVFATAPIGSKCIVDAIELCTGPISRRRCEGTQYPCKEGKKDYKSMDIFSIEMLDTLPWLDIDNVSNEYCDCEETFTNSNSEMTGMTGVGCTEMFQICPDDSVCFHGAPCSLTGSGESYYCKCPEAYYPEGKYYVGKHCEYEVTSFCSIPRNINSMCANGGSCPGEGVNAMCDCPTGFAGHHCEFRGEAPKCDTECYNGGICKIGAKNYDSISDPLKEYFEQNDGDDGYDSHCICPKGFTGRQCESKITSCGGAECLNSGTCLDFRGSQLGMTTSGGEFEYFFCDCGNASSSIDTSEKDLETSYAGHYCESSSSTFCTPPPGFDPQDFFCTNKGTCPTNHWDECLCPANYSGPRCEFLVEYHKICDLQCENGGTCFFGDELTTTLFDDHGVEKELSKQTNALMHCKCPDGYTGLQCEVEGVICGVLGHYCLNNGECHESDDGYTCECPHDGENSYAGEYCEHVATSICGDASFCTNNGICKSASENGDDPGCICSNGFMGNFCEYSTENNKMYFMAEDIMWVYLTIIFVGVSIFFILICFQVQKKGRDENHSHVAVDTLPEEEVMYDVRIT